MHIFVAGSFQQDATLNETNLRDIFISVAMLVVFINYFSVCLQRLHGL